MSRLKRRDVLRGVLGTSLALGTGVSLLGPGTARAGSTIKVLMIGDVFAGYLIDAEGGGAYADVLTEKPGPDNVLRKHVSGVKYEDFTVQCTGGMSKVFWEWVETSMTANQPPARRSGAILTFDADLKFVSGRNFANALLTEIGFPALEAASKDAAFLTVKLRPEVVTASPARKAPKLPTKRVWQVGDFRLDIPGLEEACKRVAKIDALVLQRMSEASAVADLRDAAPVPVTTPNLVITFPEYQASSFYSWHEDFVIKGNNGQDREKTGTLEYLGPDGIPLLILKLTGLGIFKLAPDKPAGGDATRVKAEMYCETLTVAKLK